MGDHAFHVRRRLADREAAPIGPALDIRRSDEALVRATRLGDWLRLAPGEVLRDELGA